jgi:hypothetical protein
MPTTTNHKRGPAAALPGLALASAPPLLLLLLLLLLGGAQAFLLTGLVSRSHSGISKKAAGPLFSFDLQQHQQQRGPPRLDEYGLPLDEAAAQRRAPPKPLKVIAIAIAIAATTKKEWGVIKGGVCVCACMCWS